jgi:hypothetical protein
MPIFRTILVLAALVFLALVVWAAFNASIIDSFAMVAADPWGLVALVDLYAGFAVTSFVVASFERSRPVGVIVILGIFLLGNVVSLLWLAARLPDLMRRLRSAP